MDIWLCNSFSQWYQWKYCFLNDCFQRQSYLFCPKFILLCPVLPFWVQWSWEDTVALTFTVGAGAKWALVSILVNKLGALPSANKPCYSWKAIFPVGWTLSLLWCLTGYTAWVWIPGDFFVSWTLAWPWTISLIHMLFVPNFGFSGFSSLVLSIVHNLLGVSV